MSFLSSLFSSEPRKIDLEIIPTQNHFEFGASPINGKIFIKLSHPNELRTLVFRLVAFEVLYEVQKDNSKKEVKRMAFFESPPVSSLSKRLKLEKGKHAVNFEIPRLPYEPISGSCIVPNKSAIEWVVKADLEFEGTKCESRRPIFMHVGTGPCSVVCDLHVTSVQSFWTQKNVTYRVNLMKACFNAGEFVEFNLQVENPSRTEIVRLDIDLKQDWFYKKGKNEEKVVLFTTDVQAPPLFPIKVNSKVQKLMQIKLPDTITPTTLNWILPRNFDRTPVTVTYNLTFTFKNHSNDIHTFDVPFLIADSMPRPAVPHPVDQIAVKPPVAAAAMGVEGVTAAGVAAATLSHNALESNFSPFGAPPPRPPKSAFEMGPSSTLYSSLHHDIDLSAQPSAVHLPSPASAYSASNYPSLPSIGSAAPHAAVYVPEPNPVFLAPPPVVEQLPSQMYDMSHSVVDSHPYNNEVVYNDPMVFSSQPSSGSYSYDDPSHYQTQDWGSSSWSSHPESYHENVSGDSHSYAEQQNPQYQEQSFEQQPQDQQQVQDSSALTYERLMRLYMAPQ